MLNNYSLVSASCQVVHGGNAALLFTCSCKNWIRVFVSVVSFSFSTLESLILKSPLRSLEKERSKRLVKAGEWRDCAFCVP